MSKFAVRALADSLRYELEPDGVSVTLISPGFVQSEIRQIDNEGKWHPKGKDPVPMWIQMPADKAARQIYSAAKHRRKHKVVTVHGKVFVFLQNHCPWVVRTFIRSSGITARPQPKKTQPQQRIEA